jgi:hypothetical protein
MSAEALSIQAPKHAWPASSFRFNGLVVIEYTPWTPLPALNYPRRQEPDKLFLWPPLQGTSKASKSAVLDEPIEKALSYLSVRE